MTTSGIADWNPEITEVIDEAYERVGAEGARTGYDLRTARRSLQLLFVDFANRGLNMWTFAEGTISLVQGVATYDLPSDTVDLLEHYIRTGAGTTQSDIAIPRISVSTYSTIPNKNATGRPVQVFIERLSAPRITVWPVPDRSDTYTLRYWRMRRIQDPGNGANTMDVPFRFYPCMIAGLAYYLALKVPGGMERLGILKAQYDEAMQVAMDEDRERSPVRLTPRMGYV